MEKRTSNPNTDEIPFVKREDGVKATDKERVNGAGKREEQRKSDMGQRIPVQKAVG
jgi:hypothetical protein